MICLSEPAPQGKVQGFSLSQSSSCLSHKENVSGLQFNLKSTTKQLNLHGRYDIPRQPENKCSIKKYQHNLLFCVLFSCNHMFQEILYGSLQSSSLAGLRQESCLITDQIPTLMNDCIEKMKRYICQLYTDMPCKTGEEYSKRNASIKPHQLAIP